MIMEILFGPKSPETINEAISEEFKKSKWPNTVFRYCEVNDWLIESFVNKRFYFPKYADLNDPCEGFYDVHFKWDEKNLRFLFQRMKGQSPYYKTRQAIEQVYGSGSTTALNILSNITEDEYISMMWEFFKNTGNSDNATFKRSQRNIDLENIRIFSLTSNPSSPVMCYNYAGRNKGVCLEFHTNAPPFNKILPVIYRDKPFTWNPIAGDLEQTVARMCVKHTDWALEREWRVCGHSSELVNEMYHPFFVDQLKSVTFCRDTSEKDKRDLMNALARSGWTCKIGVNIFKFAEDENRTSYNIIRQKYI